jgi:HPt (histidine-containing phosphotransfer) domain-containing protein
MTANVLKEAVDACRQAGMDDFLPKPFLRSQAIDVLARWLGPTADVASATPHAEVDPMLDTAIDSAYYRQVEKTMGEEMSLLLEDFLSSSRQSLGDMSRAAVEHDWRTIKRQAHALRSSAGAVGATRLAALAADLESRANSDRVANIEEFVATLAMEFERVRCALKRLSDLETRAAETLS